MSTERKWARLPVGYGPYWFCKDLKDRDLADFVRVSQIQHGGEEPFFCRGYERFYDKPIKPDEGWWLPILDERKTAPAVVSSGLLEGALVRVCFVNAAGHYDCRFAADFNNHRAGEVVVVPRQCLEGIPDA